MTIAICLFITALAGAPVASATAPLAAETAPTVSPAALKLAATTNPAEGITSESDRLFTGGELAESMRADPEMAETEREYPGLIDHIAAQMRPTIERQVMASLPTLWNRLARIYDANLTPAEIDQAQRYYGSSAGSRLIRAVSRHFDYKPMLSESAQDEDVSTTSMRQGLAAGMPAIIAQMSSEDQAALMAFARTPTFTKIQKINPEIARVKAAWVNESTPEADAELEAVVTKAAEEFIAQKEAKK
ncbi:hypothetical protein K9B35_12315 [Sphingomonas sp. R647]|uniref:hypothetical protein n=1 Tax=Sphingomonas sp. R647 TaxID=2875233 RepID=UPI001CD46A69|nr:hypothetical protein [Sphingomonas sp. R647]MCA1198755.1 hypothetical protein [Sphingomonas sp. R647]